MARKQGSDPAGKRPAARDDRLKAALKANLARRKAQSRLRGENGARKDATPGTAGQDKDD